MKREFRFGMKREFSLHYTFPRIIRMTKRNVELTVIPEISSSPQGDIIHDELHGKHRLGFRV